MQNLSVNLYDAALDCLMCADPMQKVAMVQCFYKQLPELLKHRGGADVDVIASPGRPDLPLLVSARGVPKRPMGTLQGRVTLLHALAHIEFNAINLALDAVYRFRDMPEQYVIDWVRVAKEEAYHFTLMSERLLELDCYYGAIVAHNGLWDMCCRTDHDVMVRMALVPRVLEARGLDVAPKMIEKLRSLQDPQSAEILEIIYRDEIDHVRIGNHWFLQQCELRQLQPQTTFLELLEKYSSGYLRGPFNHKARRRAGFTEAELQGLEKLQKNG